MLEEPHYEMSRWPIGPDGVDLVFVGQWYKDDAVISERPIPGSAPRWGFYHGDLRLHWWGIWEDVDEMWQAVYDYLRPRHVPDAIVQEIREWLYDEFEFSVL